MKYGAAWILNWLCVATVPVQLNWV